MKKLQSTIAIALLATTVFFNANAGDKLPASNKLLPLIAKSSMMSNYKASNLNVGMYEVGNVNSLKLNIALTKDTDKTAKIKLMDEKGTVLNEETIAKKLAGYQARFDFSGIKDGKYFIEVVNGNSIITKEIIKSNSTLSY